MQSHFRRHRRYFPSVGLGIQGAEDFAKADGDRLDATGDDHEERPVENRQSGVGLIAVAPPEQGHGDPGAEVQGDHAPRFTHHAAEFPLDPQGLAERAYVGDP